MGHDASGAQHSAVQADSGRGAVFPGEGWGGPGDYQY
jgi:hypothetical protein